MVFLLKTIKTLVKDIQDRLSNPEPVNEEEVTSFSHNLARKLVDRLCEKQRKVNLRLSNIGTPCDRKLWYSINTPELGEPLPPSARLKFLIGDILEEVLLFLAKVSGHKVEHQQKEVSLYGVTGHIDAVIDGELVDVKSASTHSFRKFKDGRLKSEDAFGYLDQLGGYAHSLSKRRGHFLVGDKTLGHLTLDTHDLPDRDWERVVNNKREMLAWPKPPERQYRDKEEGKSGNRKLGLECSYCPFKAACWPGLRAFLYSSNGHNPKPVFLTVVAKQPNVPEITLKEAVADE